MKLIKIKLLVITMFYMNFVFAAQKSNKFEVSFMLLPSCQIKTDNIIDKENNLKIIYNCSHEDFYVTTLKNDKNIDISSNNYNISRVKNITTNEVHSLVRDVKKEETLLTINF